MKKGFYRRSFLWMLAFFGLPAALFGAMLAEVSRWENPTWVAAVNEEELTPRYQTTTMILAAVGAIPYLCLLLRFSERLQLTDKSIRRKALFRNRKLLWEDIIECRDHLNYIQLLPMYGSSAIYIDYYATFNKHRELSRLITRKCREVEANLMVGRRRGRLLPCDLGIVPTSVFVAASSVLLLYCRQRVVLLGILSGTVLALLSACVWVITRRHPRRWKSGGYIYVTLLALSLILPPAYFLEQIRTQGLMALGTFAIFYLVGLLAGSGVISTLLPSRKRR